MTSLFPSDADAPMSISELTGNVKELLETAFPSIWITGEVSNLAKPRSGHLYLKLKDASSQVNAVIYRGIALRMRFDLKDGMEVLARGRVSVYEPRGDYQFLVEELQPKGIGPLELAFRQLKEKLSTLGYFEPSRKKSLPRYPRHIALVTSPTGAAVRDMLEILQRRWKPMEIHVCPVAVQGEGAAEQIVEMLGKLNHLNRRPEVIILGRGGGSLEDLWPFNEEIVAEAIGASEIPIVSGVGHETDLTIADLVADVRALTPSEAAERVTPNQKEILEWLGNCKTRMTSLLKGQLKQARSRLEDLSQRRCFREPLQEIRQREQQIDDLSERLQRAIRLRLQNANQRMEALVSQLESLSPLSVLSRGYSLTRRETGTIIRRPQDVAEGEQIVTELSTGQLISRVESSSSHASGDNASSRTNATNGDADEK